jgi:ElaB/YqjD/DUF883 family membrane-anchored ribosome-binding protein
MPRKRGIRARPLDRAAAPASENRTTVVTNKLADAQGALTKRHRMAAAETTEDFVRDNPWKATTIATLAGFT